MRVATLTSRFPSLSQTFVLNQVTGLLEEGCDLEVFADAPDPTNLAHPEVSDRRLLDCTTYYGVPSRYMTRVWRGGRLWRTGFRASPHIRARALDVWRYGVEAASLRLLFEARAFAARRPYDVVHGHFGPSGLLATKLRDAGALRGPVITSFYGYDVSRARYAARYAFLFRHGDRFIAISHHMRTRLIAWGCDPAKITVHRLGIDLRRFAPAASKPRTSPHIITVARFVPKKGIEYGLRAVAALVRECPDVRYTIIGDGPLRPRLTRLAHELRLGDTVRFVGWQTQPAVIELMQQSDVLLAPSVTAADGDAEGTPVAIMEAHALGLPVVATLHEGVPEVVADRVSGYLAPERDVAALTDALARLLEAPTLRRRMGEAGRDMVAARHDIRTLNRELRRLYEEVKEAT